MNLHRLFICVTVGFMKRLLLPALICGAASLLPLSPLYAEPGDPLPASQRPPAPALLEPKLPCQKMASTPIIFASKHSDDALHMRVQCVMDKGQDGLWRAQSCSYHSHWNGFYMPRPPKVRHYRDVVTNYMDNACFTDGQLTPYLSDEQNEQPDSISDEDAWTSRTITPWREDQFAHGISPAQDEKLGAIYLNNTRVMLKLSFTHRPPVTAEENDTDKAAHSPHRFEPAPSIINLDAVSAVTK
ncbi:hypothetical protein BG621_02470 [Parasaccharibacter apium]|nr:hypothetical protein BG621_02470 [Parasaccharibacter apium]